MTPTSAKRAFVLSRDRDQRLGQGGIRTLSSWEVVRRGREWVAIFLYNDGTTWEVMGPGGSRGVPALA